MGQQVSTLVDAYQEQGIRSVTWNGKDSHGNNVPSGIYLTYMTAGSFEQVKKMTLIR